MEQDNNNGMRNILIVIIIVLVIGTVLSVGFYIFTTQNKMAKLENDKYSTRPEYDFNKVCKAAS